MNFEVRSAPVLDENKMYKLIGKDGKPYFSEEKGQLGGNGNAKIYGRLDCPSALRAINCSTKEVYIKSRVFFADEKTALSAGYRPCGTCMREHYKLWKEGKLLTPPDEKAN
ncbi:MAG: hypothetical protein RR365_02345 [Bacteroides sp.]